MFQALTRQGRVPLALLMVLAISIAVVACGGNKGTTAPGASGAGSSAMATEEPSSGGGGGDLSGASSKFSNITSYKFSMTILSSDLTSSLSALTGGSSDQPVVFSGTVITKPEKAVDLSIGSLRIIEVGGNQYMDLGSGTFISTPVSGTSMADSFSPAEMFSSVVDASTASDFNKVGTETKNGVSADHYTANAAALAEFGSLTDVTADSWSADVWIATDGGYPVSLAIVAKNGGTVVYQITFDITNVNDPANKVTAPATS
jgi:hypothetical protein